MPSPARRPTRHGARPCGWRRRLAGRYRPRSSVVGELSAQNLAGPLRQIVRAIEAPDKGRQLVAGGLGIRIRHHGDVHLLTGTHVGPAELRRQLGSVTWNSELPLLVRT